MNQCHLLPAVASSRNQVTICDMTPKYLDTFGKRVRVLRTEHGWTQQQLVDELERVGAPIGRSYVSEWERSDKIPTGDVVAALARVLETTADYLLLLVDEAEIVEDAQEVDAISEEAEDVARMVDAMTPERRSDTLAIVRALYDKDRSDTKWLRRLSAVLDRYVDKVGEDEAERALSRLIDSASSSGTSALGGTAA